jgi:hypothetical protein
LKLEEFGTSFEDQIKTTPRELKQFKAFLVERKEIFDLKSKLVNLLHH